jgi:hypothetical protein
MTTRERLPNRGRLRIPRFDDMGRLGHQPQPRRRGSLAYRSGDAWFDRWEAANHEVHEQTIHTGDDEILTLVLISDPRLLEDHNDRRGRR